MINEVELDKTRKDLEHHVPLNMKMIGNIFGNEFWEILVLCMLDSREAQTQLLEMIKEK